MKRFAKLVSLSMQSALFYREAFLINLFTPIVLLAGQFMLWHALYGSADTALGGMSRADMYAYILTAFVVNNLLTWSSENALSREIRSGAVISRCIRPVSFLWQSVAGMSGFMLPQALVNSMLAAVGFIVFHRFFSPPALGMLPAALLSLVLGVLLRMLLVSCFSLLCFYTTNHLGLTWTRTALNDFFSGAMIPLALFPQWLRTISYCTPFPLMLQVPVSLFLGQPLPFALPALLAMQAGWVLIFAILHRWFYGHIRKNMVHAGG